MMNVCQILGYGKEFSVFCFNYDFEKPSRDFGQEGYIKENGTVHGYQDHQFNSRRLAIAKMKKIWPNAKKIPKNVKFYCNGIPAAEFWVLDGPMPKSGINYPIL